MRTRPRFFLHDKTSLLYDYGKDEGPRPPTCRGGRTLDSVLELLHHTSLNHETEPLTMEMDGKVAVNGSGIEEATAVIFAQEGARVAICGSWRKRSIRSIRASDVEQLYWTVDDHWGRLDVVFAHAGIKACGPLRSWSLRSGVTRSRSTSLARFTP